MFSREIFNVSKKEEELRQIKSFSDLFVLLGSSPDKEHRRAYEEVLEFAKKLVETGQKTDWNTNHEGFKNELLGKYPNVPKEFVLTLVRCIENYNPPVNIPEKHLWDVE